MDLSTAEECSGAVNYAKSFNAKVRYVTGGSYSGSHKGCLIYDSGGYSYMLFNTHSHGGRSPEDTSICRKSNPQCLVHFQH